MNHLAQTCSRCGHLFQQDSSAGPRMHNTCPTCRHDTRIRKREEYENTRGVPRAQLVRRELSRRENQVAELVSVAHSNKEIGILLHLATGTVSQYVEHIMDAWGVDTRLAIALEWLRRQRAKVYE